MWVRRKIRKIVVGLVVLVLLPLTLEIPGHWLIAWAEERGWFNRPSERLDAAMAYLSVITASPWFTWIGGGILGFAVSVWLDALFKRRDEGKAPTSPEDKAVRSEVLAFYRSWLLVAAGYQNHLLKNLVGALSGSENELANQVCNLLSRSVMGAERKSLSTINITLIENIHSTADEIQLALGDYWTKYQQCREWIVWLCGYLGFKRGDANLEQWLESDQVFLLELRRLAGPPRFEKLRQGIESIGWGDWTTRQLNTIPNETFRG